MLIRYKLIIKWTVVATHDHNTFSDRVVTRADRALNKKEFYVYDQSLAKKHYYVYNQSLLIKHLIQSAVTL